MQLSSQSSAAYLCLDPRLGPWSLSLRLTRHRRGAFLSQPRLWHLHRHKFQSLGGLFQEKCWLILPLPHSFCASTCNFRINTFICTHTY